MILDSDDSSREGDDSYGAISNSPGTYKSVSEDEEEDSNPDDDNIQTIK